MSAIFISHSSHDNATAADLALHLRTAGYQSLFLDFDPADGIPAGRNWERELYQALQQCRAVVVLCSQHSMASDWCFAEVTHARALGKAIFPIKIADCELKPILTDLQVLDLTQNPEQGYHGLWSGLRAAGLDPFDTFAWNTSRAPYPGLSAFQESDAGVFFGRDDDIRTGLDVLNRLRRFGGSRLVVLSGGSGSGKSSLVRAGLVPRLRRDKDGWLVLGPVRPRQDPFGELALVLAQAGMQESLPALRAQLRGQGADPKPNPHGFVELLHRIRIHSGHRDATALLVIDQFEELLGDAAPLDADAFCGFLRAVLEAVENELFVLCTVRSDFLSDILSHFRDQPFESLTLSSLSAAGVAQAVEKPAALAGVELEPGFVQAIVADIETDDALPLLAFALRELWDRCGSSGKFTIDDYHHKIGGLEGAVRDTAEAVIQALPLTAAELASLRRAFLGLVRINEEGNYTRRPARFSDLPPPSHALLLRFVDARLLVASDDAGERTVEVAHEALFRSWQRLREWLEEDRDFLHWRRRLRQSLVNWQNAGQDDEALLRGVALAEAQNQLVNRAADISPDERAFIQRSIDDAERQRRRRRQRNQAIGVGLSVLTLVSLVFGWFAYQRSIEADHARTQAEQAQSQAEDERRVAVAGQLAAQARIFLEDRLDLALLFSLEAHRLNPSWQTRSALLTAIQSAQSLEAYLTRHLFPVTDIAFSPDGQTLASASQDHSIILWDVATRRPKGPRLHGHTNWVQSVSFSPDGAVLASASDDHHIRLWNTQTGEPIGEPLTGHEGSVLWVTFSPNGRILASAGQDGTVRLWNAETGVPLGQPLAKRTGWVTGLAFHPQIPLLAATGVDDTVSVFDMTTGQSAFDFKLGPEASGWAIAFSPDGKILAATSRTPTQNSRGSSVWLWDVETRELRHPPLSIDDWLINSIAFSPDGKFLLTGRADSRIAVWKVETGQVATVLPAYHSRGVSSVAFSPDTSLFASAGKDGTVLLWRTQPAQRLGKRFGQQSGHLLTLDVNRDGTLIASGGEDGQVFVWDATGQTAFEPLDSDLNGRVAALDFHPTQPMLAAGSQDGTIVLFDTASRTPLGPPLRHHKGEVKGLAFSLDGKTLASGSADGTVIFWDMATRAPRIGPIVASKKNWVWSLAFSPDGTTLAHGAELGSVVLRDSRYGERLGKPLIGHDRLSPTALRFSPDGRWLASGSADNRVVVWDIRNGSSRGAALVGHENWVMGVDFSPDSQTLASASRDNTILLWDVASQQRIGLPLSGHSGAVMNLAFTPDGRQLVSGSYTGEIFTWSVDIEAWHQTACAIANRNLTFDEWQRYLAGEPYHKTCPDLPTDDDPETEKNLILLVQSTYGPGQYEEAESLAQRVLAMRERRLGPQHPEMVEVLQLLARIAHAQGRYERALTLWERAESIVKQFPAMHRERVGVLNGLASAYEAQGHYAVAEPLYRNALEQLTRYVSPDHDLVPALHNNIGALLCRQGRLDEAERELKHALTLQEQLLGADNPERLFILLNLGDLEKERGNGKKAEQLYQQALQVWKPARVDVDSIEALAHARLGEFYLSEGRLQEAEPVLKHALEVRQQVLNREHPHLLESLKTYAKLLRLQGRADEAAPYEARIERSPSP